ncbi:thioesterase family protein [Nocardia sp. NPDC051052]|uniref:thioesterase family protein n=1 Tax=Nocardia sp. NPDC051052 TaxID=3364322 RepID=UPI00379679E3
MTSMPAATTHVGRPRFNGANIHKYIGFKNFMFLAEDAVLQHFREGGIAPGRMFDDYGLGLEIVDISTRLINIMSIDDEIEAVVETVSQARGPGMVVKVRLDAIRPDGRVQVLGGKLRVVFVSERDGTPVRQTPEGLAELTVPEVSAISGASAVIEFPDDPVATLAPENGFLWELQIPYYFCHWYTRMQSNGYIRLLEEGTDRFLRHAGLGITELLAQRDWIPLVSRARVQMHADAYMGETMYITYVVDDILKNTVYDSTMTCWVRRDDHLIKVATCTILHGWMIARGPSKFEGLIAIDEQTAELLLGGATKAGLS